MSKKVLIAIADGVEEIEAIAPADILRRAGAEVTIVSVTDLQITGTNGIKIIADKLINEVISVTFDLIILPGGMPGAEHLRDSEVLINLLKGQQERAGLYAAICASPVVVLQTHNLLEGKKATCHPALYAELRNGVNERVVVDKNCITSQGPGTALEFGVKLAEILFGKDKAGQLVQGMVITS